MYQYRIKKENSDNKPVAIVLGGTVPHKNLIDKLRERGYYTILIDYFDDPPAAEAADIHCVESAMDINVVQDVAQEYNAEVILSSCLDQQMNIAMQVAENLGLKHPFSPELTERVTNKQLMKKIMMEGGIPTSKYYIVDKTTDLSILDLVYPIIVKPVDSCGSAGVIKMDSSENLENNIRESMRWSKDGRVIVEEFVTGTEMGVHCYVKDGIAQILLCTAKLTSLAAGTVHTLCNVYLPMVSPVLHSELERIANLIVAKFDLPANTPMFMQVIVKDGKVSVIEFSPRIAGGTTSYVVEKYAGFDLLNYSIDSYVGETNDRGTSSLKNIVVACLFYGLEGTFDRITGAKELADKGIVRDVIILKMPGEEINVSKPSSACFLKYVFEGESVDECYAKLDFAQKYTDCLDKGGNSLMDRRCVVSHEKFCDYVSELL